MDNRPSEQISTAYRYTSTKQTDIVTPRTRHQNSGIIKVVRLVYGETGAGLEMKTVPANKRHSPSLVSSSRVKCTVETKKNVSNRTLMVENYAQTKFLCKLLLSEGTNPIEQTDSVVSRNIRTAVMEGYSTAAFAKPTTHTQDWLYCWSWTVFGGSPLLCIFTSFCWLLHDWLMLQFYLYWSEKRMNKDAVVIGCW